MITMRFHKKIFIFQKWLEKETTVTFQVTVKFELRLLCVFAPYGPFETFGTSGTFGTFGTFETLRTFGAF